MNEMVWRGDFPGERVQLGKVRRLAAALLQDSPVRDDAISCLAELVGNAILHTRSVDSFFTVGIWSAGAFVRVAVKDAGGWSEPSLRSGRQTGLAESGRGLSIVVALAERLGVAGDEDGRVVWADLSCEGDGAQADVARTAFWGGVPLLEPVCGRCWMSSGRPSQSIFSAASGR
ncbi:ATP-binding protein [Nonomuraea coxensis]|uniref:ATP-binding protein n=1 Tax=Nonomuraea coxensis TaxID=404386 RepID=UPI0003639E22|nr:ATP-binding protein [Nonomuraea coxensis]